MSKDNGDSRENISGNGEETDTRQEEVEPNVVIKVFGSPVQSVDRSARIVRTVIVSAVTATAMLLFTYTLRGMDSIPLRNLISIEDDLFDMVAGRTLDFVQGSRPVVFIDVDQNAVDGFKTAERQAGETPRALVAKLINAVRGAQASVLYIDLDMRSEVADNQLIKDEFRIRSSTEVLLPSFFAPGLTPPCQSQLDDLTPAEFPSWWSQLIDSGAVTPVHPIVSIGPYAAVEGACSSYKVRTSQGMVARREAAMVKAVAVATRHAPTCPASSPCVIPIRWAVGASDDILRTASGSTAYVRIPAGNVVGTWSAMLKGRTDLTILRDSIVIIGSTHRYAGDIQTSPQGPIAGALVQVNLGLTLQAAALATGSSATTVLVDLAMLVVCSLVSLLTYRIVQTESKRTILDAALAAGIGLLFFSTAVRLEQMSSSSLNGWRFGILTCFLTTCMVLGVSIVRIVADTLAEHVGNWTQPR